MSSQFLRVYGYPRGQRSAANTMGSVLAEGLRDKTHISHLTQPPQIEIFTNPNSPVKHPKQLGRWINNAMNRCFEGGGKRYPNGRPLRKNAVALGTLVASLPQTTQETPAGVIYDFRERSQAWFEQWLNERDMLLHACVDGEETLDKNKFVPHC